MTAPSSQVKRLLSDPVQYLKGVGPHIAALLARLGIHTVFDLLYHFPQRYLDRRLLDTFASVQPGKNRSVIGEIIGFKLRSMGARRKMLQMIVGDDTGRGLVSWFHFNEHYFKKKYPIGKKLLIFGECQFYGSEKQFTHPDIEEWQEEEGNPGFLTVYPLTEGLYQKTLRNIISKALEIYLPFLPETPLSVRASGEVSIGLKEALQALHNPPPQACLEELNEQNSPWHQRVLYDELFYLQLGLALRKKKYLLQQGPPLLSSNLSQTFEKMKSLLPFSLTRAQVRVIDEIVQDIQTSQPMNRLVQGDVGCGKTLVAFLSSLPLIENGYQVALMAPTEILAQQHYQNLKNFCDSLKISLGLLTGSLSQGNKNELGEKIQKGQISLVIGTHALLESPVAFANLGYAIIDEQHRFGVKQRGLLKEKGKNFIPHILLMTATPIPRTLAMGLYGDLAVSVIDELPANRKPIRTRVLYEKQRNELYDFVARELEKKSQAYFIYPLVEESEKSDLKDAQSMAEHLQKVFYNQRVGLLHGRMKADLKEQVMNEFKKGEIQLLVSTTVVEVGVDVPQATVMVIEHAERFGLSQLHQLRGRVGRGGDASFCFLMAGYAQSEESRFRLRIMEETQDGFRIAEEDLHLRGPGDFVGTRQAGLADLHFSEWMRHPLLLSTAQKRVQEILQEDPDLSLPPYLPMKQILQERWGLKLEMVFV